MAKRSILAILAHPDRSSLCGALHDAYVGGAQSAGHDIRELRLGELKFDPVLHHGYRVIQELEPDLKRAQEEIRRAEHIVLTFPTWWNTYPALLKGFLDRALLPGFGFQSRPHSLLWNRLLHGRSARLIVTLRSPAWIHLVYWGAPGLAALRRGTLGFCGISPIRTTLVGRAENLTREQAQRWLGRVRELGRRAR